MQLGTLLASLKERGGRLTHPKPPGKVLNLKHTRQVCIATKPQVLPSTCLSVCCGVRWDADRCAGANLLLRWLSATMHVLAAAWAAMPEQAGNIQAWRAAVVFARAPCMPNAFHAAKGAVLGIEPRTSRTLSENHATRPSSQVLAGCNAMSMILVDEDGGHLGLVFVNSARWRLLFHQMSGQPLL